MSRLRKLKRTEDEAVIEGSEYATRLKEHYLKMQGEHSMFDWAKPRQEEAQRKAVFEQQSHSDRLASSTPKKMLADSGSESSDDGSEDPIGDLLRSNTAIFSKNNEILKSGTLNYTKLRNANATSQHQSVVTSLSFHPSENLLMTAGLDRKAKLIQVRGRGTRGSDEDNRSQIV